MRIVSTVLVLGMCLLSAGCAEKPEFVTAAPPATPGPTATGPATATSPATAAGPAKATSRPTSKPAASKTVKPAASKPGSAPAAKAGPDAACDAAMTAEDRLNTVKENNGPLAVTGASSPAEITAAVQALRTATQANLRALKSGRALTTDTEVRAALTDLISARNAMITLFGAAGADAAKKDAALNTPAEYLATAKLWRYPDGVCLAYVD